MNSNWNRPHTTVVLAMSADGKIADVNRSPANFGSPNDKAHLETQVAVADAILVGAGTLRSGGTAMRVTNPELIQQRESLGKPAQPVQIICSGSGAFEPDLNFFHQPIPRWLLTTSAGSQRWEGRPHFDRIVVCEKSAAEIDWIGAFQQLAQLGMERVSILGGGDLVASLLPFDVIDEFWLTVCPLIFGGDKAPTPVDGVGFSTDMAPRLKLLSVKTIEQEVFLHYVLIPKIDKQDS